MSDVISMAIMLMMPKMVCKHPEKLLQDEGLIIGLMKSGNTSNLPTYHAVVPDHELRNHWQPLRTKLMSA